MAKKWIVLVNLILISVISQAVRFCISYIAAGSDLLDSTDTSKAEYGLITGPGFLLVYAILSLPLVRFIKGKFVDKLGKLKWFIIINSFGISVATGINAAATQYWGLVYPRCILALFSAGIDPASIKLISFGFPSQMRGLALGFYLASVYIGSALASCTLILAIELGWRISFLILGIIGLGVSTLGIFMIDNEAIIKESISPTVEKKSDWKQLITYKTILYTLIGTFFRYAAGFARGYYEALYFTSQFPDNKTLYSIINSVVLLFTPINLALAGKFSDMKEEAGQAKYRPLLCCVTNLIAVPLLITMYLTTNFGLAMGCLGAVYAVGETYISISITMMVNVTPPDLRGIRNTYLETALLMCISFFGGSLSTVTLGFLSGSHESLRNALLVTVVCGYFLAGLMFLLTVFTYPKDLQKFESSQGIRTDIKAQLFD